MKDCIDPHTEWRPGVRRMRCAGVSLAPATAWRVARSHERPWRGVGRVCAVAAPDPQNKWVVRDSARPRRRVLQSRACLTYASSLQCPETLSHNSSCRYRSQRTTRWVRRASSWGDDDPTPSATSSCDDDENTTFKILDGKIWALALPAVASLLLDPVLGAVDTAFVGRMPGEGAASALGGLAVATTVFNFSFKLFNFLAVVTGPLVASQIAAAETLSAAGTDRNGDDSSASNSSASNQTKNRNRGAAAETVTGAMTLAVVLGIVACVALEAGADTVLRWAGGDGVVDAATELSSLDGELLAPTSNRMYSEAENYLRIRALSAPAALIGTVAVGAFRGLLDTKTPLVVSGVANFVNLALDPVLIFGWGPVPAFGVAGAAAATTTAEWLAAAVFVVMLTNEGLLPGLPGGPGGEGDTTTRQTRETLLGATERGLETTTQTQTQTTNPPAGLREWAQALKPLAAGSASQLARTLLLQAVLVRATAEAAGAGAAGAHQICIQVWWVTLFALDALAVAAQSLVAASLGAGDVIGARRAADRSLKWAAAAGTAVGVGIYAAGPLLPALFTDDFEIASAAAGPLTWIAALQPLNAVVFVWDGVLQGACDFDYLAVAMAASAAPALLLLTQVSATGAASGLSQIRHTYVCPLSARNYCFLRTSQVPCFTEAGDCSDRLL